MKRMRLLAIPFLLAFGLASCTEGDNPLAGMQIHKAGSDGKPCCAEHADEAKPDACCAEEAGTAAQSDAKAAATGGECCSAEEAGTKPCCEAGKAAGKACCEAKAAESAGTTEKKSNN